MRSQSNSRQSGEFIFWTSRKGLAGWIRKDLPEDLLTDFLRDPEAAFHAPGALYLKKKIKAQVIRQVMQTREGRPWNVIIKRVRYGNLWRRLGFYICLSPALRSLENALMLKGKGVFTPPPVAALDCRDWRHVGTSYYLTEDVEGAESLPTLWLAAPSGLSSRKVFEEKRRILKSLALLFHQLHSSGIYHQDLKAGNVLVRKSGSAQWQCCLIDIDAVWKSKRLSWFRRIKNLVQMYRTFGEHLNVREKAAFLKHYCDLFCLPRNRRKAVARLTLSANENWKRRSLFNRVWQGLQGRTLSRVG